jgi:cytochrome c oxidase subunit 2
MLQGASPFSDFVDTTFLLITGISLLVLIGLVCAMILFVFKYSRKRNPTATNIEGSLPLEILWTAIPLALFMGMFYMGWKGYLTTVDVPPGAVPIKVTARMWSWTFAYPNGVETDTLHVPVRTPVNLLLTSVDVNHSLYIPAFRVKKDVIPNRLNELWFETNAVTSYDIACAEYCGLRHSYMYTKVVSHDSASFVRWYQNVSAAQGKPVGAFRAPAEKE